MNKNYVFFLEDLQDGGHHAKGKKFQFIFTRAALAYDIYSSAWKQYRNEIINFLDKILI